MIGTSNLIILLILIITGIQDLKKREVQTLFFVFGYAVLAWINTNIFIFIIPMLLTMFVTKDNRFFGGADLDAVILIFLSGDIIISLSSIIYACIMAITMSLFIKNKKNIPYVFCLAAGYFMENLLRYL